MTPWLVAEDDDDIRTIVRIMFRVWGHSALEFRDGHQTCRWLDDIEAGQYSGELPDLALLDIRMPGPRGNEIARRMRRLAPFQRIPIVVMTAFSLNDSERQTLASRDGVDYVITKPLPDLFELKQLLDTLYSQKMA